MNIRSRCKRQRLRDRVFAHHSYSNAMWLVDPTVVPQLYQLHVRVKNMAGAENFGGCGAPWFVVLPDGSPCAR
jgi:hypothetical protein